MSTPSVRWLTQSNSTHGIHRPFLPGMIQKNNEAEVQEHTRKATTLIKDIRRDQDAMATITAIENALKQVCNLKGVGPATGTLVLSIVQPKIVPFFEDELYFWLHPGHLGKLKYDKAEYRSLLTKALDIILNKNVEAHALEKTAYVLMHADKLNDAAKEHLRRCLDTPVAHTPVEKPEKDAATAIPRLPNIKPTTDEQRLAVNRSKQAEGRRKLDEDNASLRRSKRRKI